MPAGCVHAHYMRSLPHRVSPPALQAAHQRRAHQCTAHTPLNTDAFLPLHCALHHAPFTRPALL